MSPAGSRRGEKATRAATAVVLVCGALECAWRLTKATVAGIEDESVRGSGCHFRHVRSLEIPTSSGLCAVVFEISSR